MEEDTDDETNPELMDTMELDGAMQTYNLKTPTIGQIGKIPKADSADSPQLGSRQTTVEESKGSKDCMQQFQ